MAIMLPGAVELLICQYLLTNLFVYNIFLNLPARLGFHPALFLLSNRSSL